MNPRNLKFFFSLAAILSLILLFILSSLRSAEEHAVIAGLSGPRVAIAALLLAAFLVFAGFWLFSTLNTTWTSRVSQLIDNQLCCPDTLLMVSSYDLLVVLTLPVMALLGGLLHYGQIVRRMAELLICMEGLALLALAFLWASYAPVFRAGFANAALSAEMLKDLRDNVSLKLTLLGLSSIPIYPPPRFLRWGQTVRASFRLIYQMAWRMSSPTFAKTIP